MYIRYPCKYTNKILPQIHMNYGGSFYDFVDLDLEDDDDNGMMKISNSSNYLKFSRFNSPVPEPASLLKAKSSPQENRAIFMRSHDYVNFNFNEEERLEKNYQTTKNSFSSPNELSIILQSIENHVDNIEKNFILKFDPKSSFKEGRDSRVHRGNLFFKQQQQQQQEEEEEEEGHKNFVAVAVKIYKNESGALEGAQKEIKIAQITNGRQDFLKHFFSGTIEILGTSEFISVWEWIDGGTLDRRCLDKNESELIIKSVANSLNFLHSNRIAHHDLKPQNILIEKNSGDRSSRVILIDFGDSKFLQNSNIIPLDEGIGLGTLAYTAPELLSKKELNFYDPLAADVYSFGVLLYYLLNCGKIEPFAVLLPFRSVHLILTVQKGFFAGGYNPEMPSNSPFYELLQRCLRLIPEDRPKFPEILSHFS